jgi:hypothetical protein
MKKIIFIFILFTPLFLKAQTPNDSISEKDAFGKMKLWIDTCFLHESAGFSYSYEDFGRHDYVQFYSIEEIFQWGEEQAKDSSKYEVILTNCGSWGDIYFKKNESNVYVSMQINVWNFKIVYIEDRKKGQMTSKSLCLLGERNFPVSGSWAFRFLGPASLDLIAKNDLEPFNYFLKEK